MDTKLKIGWASHEAAKFACKNYHYSRCLPVGKSVRCGVWEDSKFIGVVIFSYGANNNAPKSFGLTQYQVCELTRIALTKHQTSVSRIISISLKMLQKQCPGIKLVFSYADKTNQKHHGGIYQAQGWLYLGERKTSDKGAYYVIRGKRMHGRSARAKYGNESKFPTPWYHVASQTKHIYVKILDGNYVLEHIVMPYPKRAPEAEASMRSSSTREKGGSSPTLALHSPKIRERSMNG